MPRILRNYRRGEVEVDEERQDRSGRGGDGNNTSRSDNRSDSNRNRSRESNEEENSNPDSHQDLFTCCIGGILGRRRANRLLRAHQRDQNSRNANRNSNGRQIHAYVADYHPYNCYPGAPILDPERKFLGAVRLPSYHRSMYSSSILIFPKTPSPNSDSFHEGVAGGAGNTRNHNDFSNIIMNTGHTFGQIQSPPSYTSRIQSLEDMLASKMSDSEALPPPHGHITEGRPNDGQVIFVLPCNHQQCIQDHMNRTMFQGPNDQILPNSADTSNNNSRSASHDVEIQCGESTGILERVDISSHVDGVES